jgi:hypothetical protein
MSSPPDPSLKTPPVTAAPVASKTYLLAGRVRARYGDICAMTLQRWCKSKSLDFPKPRRINGRNFWNEAELDEWDRTHPDSARRQPPPRKRPVS